MNPSGVMAAAPHPLYKVGIYCRLSKDDSSNTSKSFIPSDESVSIENQKTLLSKFVMLNGWTETKTYVDDGYSGANFQRPGFLQMLEDARKGIINLILVKDLSRLGRDFVEVGRYTDEIFPALGCRFVSVLDCLDTEGDNTDMLHFRSLMNDYHLKDLSSKVKSVLLSRKKNGFYAAGQVPYGYRKSEDGKNLVIDEPAAKVVRKVFNMRLDGTAYSKIAAALNQENIPAPRAYLYDEYSKDRHKPSVIWLYASIKNILHNEVYRGITVLNQTGTLSYKNSKTIKKPEAEWIRHEGTHDAIISQEVWDAVQTMNNNARKRAEGNTPPTSKLFTGKLICADCKCRLTADTETQKRKKGPDKKYVSYYCSRYTSSGRSICSRHRIYEITLSKIVMAEIKAQAEAITMDEAGVVEKLRRRITQGESNRLAEAQKEITRLRHRVDELENMIAKLYEDKISGVISENTFSLLVQKNEQERMVKAERLDALLSEVNKMKQDTDDIHKWAAAVRKHLNIQKLDRDIIDELIDHIEIGERTVIDGERHQDIKVFYRFVGSVN